VSARRPAIAACDKCRALTTCPDDLVLEGSLVEFVELGQPVASCAQFVSSPRVPFPIRCDGTVRFVGFLALEDRE